MQQRMQEMQEQLGIGESYVKDLEEERGKLA